MFKIKFVEALLVLIVSVFCVNAQEDNKGLVLHRQVTRVIDMMPKEDTVDHYFRDQNPDTVYSLFAMILEAIQKEKITAWSDSRFTEKVTKSHLLDMLEWGPDTVLITDPVTGEKIMKFVQYDFDPDWFHKYAILENWRFDNSISQTQIGIEGIGPVKEKYNFDGSIRFKGVMFWLKYEDVRDIIEKYEQYHPENTFALHIWNDYFLSDIKPEAQK